jgi:hypothetical protein
VQKLRRQRVDIHGVETGEPAARDFTMSFIKFEKSPSASGKTSIYRVLSKSSGALLGTIHWWCKWRQYVFEAEPTVVWSDGCLQDVVQAVRTANEEQRKRIQE